MPGDFHMSANSSTLLLLLRMLDNDLPALVAGKLEQQMQDDALLARQYLTLQKFHREADPARGVGERLTQADPNLVAAFVEGRLSTTESQRFETECWRSEALMREVMSLVRREPPAGDSPASGQSTVARAASVGPSADAMKQHVSRLLSAPPPEAVPGQKTVAAEAFGVGSTATDKHAAADQMPDLEIIRLPVADGEEPTISMPEVSSPTTATPLRNGRRRSRSATTLVLLALMLVVAVAVLNIVFNNLPDRRVVQPDPSSGDAGSREDSPGVRERQIVQNGDSDPQTEAPEAGPPAPAPDQSEVVRTPEAEDARPQMAPRPTPRLLRPALPQKTTIVAWNEVSGVAAAKLANGPTWSGIARAAEGLWTVGAQSQLLTLSYSRIEGELSNGAAVIADADSLLEFGTTAAGPGEDSAADLPPLLTVHRGRLAIRGLREGQRLLIQLGFRVLELRASAASTLGIERVNGEIILAAYRGEFQSREGQITRRLWGRVDRNGQLSTFRPAQRDEWYTATEIAAVIPGNVCESLNTSADFVADAGEFEQAEALEVQAIALQAALNGVAGPEDVLSATLAARLAGSGREQDRILLIRWLIMRFQQQLELGEADLRVVCLSQQTPARMTFAMNGWFRSAAYGAGPTVRQLSELVNGLSESAPLFTRQCALVFLRQILQDPLREYSVLMPRDRNALRAVATRVRQWQQQNR